MKDCGPLCPGWHLIHDERFIVTVRACVACRDPMMSSEQADRVAGDKAVDFLNKFRHGVEGRIDMDLQELENQHQLGSFHAVRKALNWIRSLMPKE